MGVFDQMGEAPVMRKDTGSSLDTDELSGSVCNPPQCPVSGDSAAQPHDSNANPHVMQVMCQLPQLPLDVMHGMPQLDDTQIPQYSFPVQPVMQMVHLVPLQFMGMQGPLGLDAMGEAEPPLSPHPAAVESQVKSVAAKQQQTVLENPGIYNEASQPEVLTRTVSSGGTERVLWAIPDIKLRSGDTKVISPAFAVGHKQFKLMLFPRASGEGKGGASFKKAKGKGFIQLKCESNLSESGATKFHFFVGSQQPRGPVVHDFSHSAVKGLPQEIEIWDLQKSVAAGQLIVGVALSP